MNRLASLFVLLPVAFALFLLPEKSYALAFEPTESEWAMWPDYCRARYVVSGSGATSTFANRVPTEEVASHKNRIGDAAWVYLHHYCAGIVYLNRAATNLDENRVAFLLTEAEREIMNQYALLNHNDPMFPQVSISIAQVHRAKGNIDSAIEFLEEAIRSHPESTSPYALAAIIHKDSGDVRDGLEFLLRGNEATSGKSAELHYFLGLFYLDVKDIDSAVVHAQRAYELGYPLPGLATKLQRLGQPIQ